MEVKTGRPGFVSNVLGPYSVVAQKLMQQVSNISALANLWFVGPQAKAWRASMSHRTYQK